MRGQGATLVPPECRRRCPAPPPQPGAAGPLGLPRPPPNTQLRLPPRCLFSLRPPFPPVLEAAGSRGGRAPGRGAFRPRAGIAGRRVTGPPRRRALGAADDSVAACLTPRRGGGPVLLGFQDRKPGAAGGGERRAARRGGRGKGARGPGRMGGGVGRSRRAGVPGGARRALGEPRAARRPAQRASSCVGQGGGRAPWPLAPPAALWARLLPGVLAGRARAGRARTPTLFCLITNLS